MKITFIYNDRSLMNSNRFNRGVAILSAVLKRAGFDVSLIHIVDDLSREEFLSKLEVEKPDMLAYSYMSLQYKNILPYIEWSNELDLLTIHGGLHPTVNPNECFTSGLVSILCRGEGDLAILEFCQKVKEGKDYRGVENFSFLVNNKVVHNPIRPAVEDLDSLPFMDYGVFQYEKLRESTLTGELVFQASRGCHYNCTYCCNHLQKSLIPNSRKYLRFHSVDRVLSEIAAALKKYPFLKTVTFDDDTLTQDREWFEEFASKYPQQIGIPYMCNDRVNNINETSASSLAKSGCVRVTMGIESGNETIRRKVMKRPISDEKILRAYNLLKEQRIERGAFNILGMREETISSVLDTIRLNARANPDKIYNAYFYPFYGTEAYSQIVALKLPIADYDVNDFFSGPVVTLETITRTQLIFFYRYFALVEGIYKVIFHLPHALAGHFEKGFESILKCGLFPYRIFTVLFPGKDQIVHRLQQYGVIYRILRAFKKKVVG